MLDFDSNYIKQNRITEQILFRSIPALRMSGEYIPKLGIRENSREAAKKYFIKRGKRILIKIKIDL